jgi:hypothetical protein
MKRPRSRHYAEEELLMHLLDEETSDMGKEISAHLLECDECDGIFKEYGDLVERIHAWAVLEVSEEVWQAQKAALLTLYRQDFAGGRGKGIISFFLTSLETAWNYALEHPLSTLGYVAVAIAFALQQTISTFRLDRILPGASQVFEILRQVF